MKRFLSFSLAIFTCVCVLIATERQAKAYVDPGTGFLALQSGASFLAAAAFFLRRRIMAFFGKKEASETSLPTSAKKDGTHSAA
jgi:hypothetical protein